MEYRDFDHQPGAHTHIQALASGAYLATALGDARQSQLACSRPVTDWLARLFKAHERGRLSAELPRLRRYGLIIVDEVGYLPSEQDVANLFVQLVSARYEPASLILASNLPFS